MKINNPNPTVYLLFTTDCGNLSRYTYFTLNHIGLKNYYTMQLLSWENVNIKEVKNGNVEQLCASNAP